MERSREDILAGGRAEFVVQRDAAGHRLYLDAEGREMDIDGRDVALTIDAHVQDLAETALARAVEHNNGRAGSCVVVDVESVITSYSIHYTKLYDSSSSSSQGFSPLMR